ncbi:hypothetical protein HRH25_17215 [Flavisolibacter sp. BT320]|nr:hypothetical protein [Flavisolibacter longurius]
MNGAPLIVLKALRKMYQKIQKNTKPELTEEFAQYRGQEASDIIKNLLLANAPAMIARFGSNELNCITNYHHVTNDKGKYLSYIRGDVGAFWWDKRMMQYMSTGAGFFPATEKNMERFATMMLQDMQQVDVLGSWLQQEALFKQQLAKAVKVSLKDLEPYYHNDPWSTALAGKKVLVIHPFTDSIKQQYGKRELLFSNKVLPEFELKTIKAVQTAADNREGFSDWFEALEYMQDKIISQEFDIAIIGCGAYGFPLAAFVKRLGKKAVHLGGGTQILFGIKGKRWEEQNKYISSLMNEHWIRPSPQERIQHLAKVEDGCYW